MQLLKSLIDTIFRREQRFHIPLHLADRYRVSGGPLDGCSVPVLERRVLDAFRGGCYRMIETDFWGFNKELAYSFYQWYEGGNCHPDYKDDKERYCW